MNEAPLAIAVEAILFLFLKQAQGIGVKYLLLNNHPLLPSSPREPFPDLPAHAHIILRQILQLSAVPVVGGTTFH
jgi:hypothetical protein